MTKDWNFNQPLESKNQKIKKIQIKLRPYLEIIKEVMM